MDKASVCTQTKLPVKVRFGEKIGWFEASFSVETLLGMVETALELNHFNFRVFLETLWIEIDDGTPEQLEKTFRAVMKDYFSNELPREDEHFYNALIMAIVKNEVRQCTK